ncbi:COG3904 Predicted periplasmic protein [Rhabdaerophilaceae bacterium]
MRFVLKQRLRVLLVPAVAAMIGTSAFGSSAMEFAAVPIGKDCSASNCPRAMVAEGEISDETPARFSRFLRKEMAVPGLHALVFLNSPGGNVESALTLGKLLHDAGASAVIGRPVVGVQSGKNKARQGQSLGLSVVPGQCASACVYTLMGAKRRVVPDGARLGVHRMSARVSLHAPEGGGSSQGRIFAGDAEIRTLRDYVSRVGGSQDLISLAESTPHDRLRLLSSDEIRRFRLGNGRL